MPAPEWNDSQLEELQLLLDSVPAGIELGGCFPAGHASSALWLAGLCVWWLPRRPRMAAAVFAAGLAAGFALGWVQQMRGATPGLPTPSCTVG